MIDTVFISDLHLHPQQLSIKAYFDSFIKWAIVSVKNVYILGDFFYAWVGDDDIDAWSLGIAEQIQYLIRHGIRVFYLHGNRDFLLGNRFAKLAGWTMIYEPAFVQLGEDKVLLMHGDSYCTKDIGHQRFRRLTRNWLFKTLFLLLPLSYRKNLVNEVRANSLSSQKSLEQMDVVPQTVIEHMVKQNVQILIHGHTHRYGRTIYEKNSQQLTRYVLSDWDDSPQILCYDYTKGLLFIPLKALQETVYE